MPAKKYVAKPIEAWKFNPDNETQMKELEKLGIAHEKRGDETVVIRNGQESAIYPGAYITVNATGDVRVYGEEFFEQQYEEVGGTKK